MLTLSNSHLLVFAETLSLKNGQLKVIPILTFERQFLTIIKPIFAGTSLAYDI